MSTLAEELERYVAIRRSLGYELVEAARTLKRFVAFANAQGVDHITTDLFLRWKDVFGSAGTCTWAERLAIVRLFAQWLQGIDPRTEVPPKSLIPRGSYRRTRPYIYSEQEIASIIAEAARLPSLGGIRSLTYTTLFGLIAVTGLRGRSRSTITMSMSMATSSPFGGASLASSESCRSRRARWVGL